MITCYSHQALSHLEGVRRLSLFPPSLCQASSLAAGDAQTSKPLIKVHHIVPKLLLVACPTISKIINSNYHIVPKRRRCSTGKLLFNYLLNSLFKHNSEQSARRPGKRARWCVGTSGEASFCLDLFGSFCG
jgi:hypothetical protein